MVENLFCAPNALRQGRNCIRAASIVGGPRPAHSCQMLYIFLRNQQTKEKPSELHARALFHNYRSFHCDVTTLRNTTAPHVRGSFAIVRVMRMKLKVLRDNIPGAWK